MATPWTVPPMFEGQTVAICASGPSMSRSIAGRVREEMLPTIVINNTHELAPWADVLYAADAAWWDVHAQTALKFAGIKVTAHDSTVHKAVMLLQPTGVEGFDPRPGKIRTGNNSGYQALHLAIQAKAKRILLFGYDMHGSHWFGKHQPPLRNTDPGSYENWIARFEGLKDQGAEIINCSRGSLIRCFPKMDINEALQ